MKKYDKKVRWDFKISITGYGQTVREALLSAADQLRNQVENDFLNNDLEAIEDHEVTSIDEEDIEE